MTQSACLTRLAAAITAFAALAGCRKANGPGDAAAFEPKESVQIVEARQTTWQPTADLVGTVVAVRSVTVRSELAATVRQVGFQSGEAVTEGQVLVQQDDTTERADLNAAQAAVRVAEANIASADAQIALAEAELKRLTQVQARAIAEVELDRARTRVDTAKADRGKWAAEADQARAVVAQVQARLAKLTIKAPFRARAGLRTVHEGQYLSEGADIVALQELADSIYLDFAIPQEYAPRVKPGTTVMATAELLGKEPVKVTVAAVDSTVNFQTRNLRVRAVVDNARGALVPGMSVQVRVPIEAPQTMTVVPGTAVRRAAYGNSVFVLTPVEGSTDFIAHQRFVTLGQTLGEDVTVTDGLTVGEKVAAAGSFKLRDKVKVMNAPAPGAPGASGGAPPTASK